MPPTILLPLVFICALLAIGLTFFLLSRAVTVNTTKDSEFQRLVIGFGVFMSILWIVIGGLFLLIALAQMWNIK